MNVAMIEVNSSGGLPFVAQEPPSGLNSRIFYLRNLYPTPAASSYSPSRSAPGAVRPLSAFELPHAVSTCVFLRSWLRKNVGMEAVTIEPVCCLFHPFLQTSKGFGRTAGRQSGVIKRPLPTSLGMVLS